MPTSFQALPAASVDDRSLALNLYLADGGHFQPSVPAGRRLADLIRGFGLQLKGDCRSSGNCAGCHVHLREGWTSRLARPTPEEAGQLAQIAGAGPGSRLACRVVMSPELDGVEVDIPPESLEPQTYWIAG